MTPPQKERIIDQAMHMFVSQGIKSVRMDDIAQQLGVSKQTLYEMFGDKEGLLYLAMERYSERNRQRWNELTADAHDVLEAMFMVLGEVMDNAEVSRRMMDNLKKFYPAVHDKLMREGMVKNRTSLRSMLEQGIEAGLFVNNFNIDLSISVLYYTASAIVTRRELMLPDGMSEREAFVQIINYNLSLPTSDKRERSIYVISDLLRKELDRIPEVREYSVMPGGDNGSMSGSATVDIKVFGYDMDVTNAVANDLKEKLGGLEGTRDVQLSRDDLRPELNVVFDRDRLAYYGMNSATASQAVRNRIDGLVASKYREDGDEYDIVVRYAEPFRMSLGDVENITLYNGQGRPVKLKEVGRVQEEYAAPMIERENRQRVITVKSSLGAGVALGDVVAEVDQLIAGYPVPDGVDLEIGGTVEDQGDAFSDLGVLFILIVILVYIVMATQFESLLFPFIIMFTIPFAATGVFLALWMTSTPMSLIALIGAIMLVGIVTKNGIVMVDYMNLLVERGSGVFDAVIAGGKSRLRPVLMTSFTTILGMLPLAIGTGVGSETWQPMGIAVIGGLTFSTLLTLFIIPALYSVFVNRSQRKEKEKLARLAAAHQASSH